MSYNLLERIKYIDLQVQRDLFPNCKTIARHWDVKERTVHRDVEFMRDRLGAPIVYSKRENGYRYVRPFTVFTGAK